MVSGGGISGPRVWYRPFSLTHLQKHYVPRPKDWAPAAVGGGALCTRSNLGEKGDNWGLLLGWV